MPAPSSAGHCLTSYLTCFVPVIPPPFPRCSLRATFGEKCYECSSPDLYRLFRMRIHLLRPENWYLVTNSLVIEEPHDRAAGPPPAYLFRPLLARHPVCSLPLFKTP